MLDVATGKSQLSSNVAKMIRDITEADEPSCM